MRNLIYVPVIHSSADLGSLANKLNQKGIAEFGEEFWQKHIDTVNGFWEAIDYYFDTIRIYIPGIKIYQDGMVADGEVATKIIEDSVKSGSKNYEIVQKLIGKGAEIIKTEDFKLVKRELNCLQSITQAKSTFIKIIKLIIYKATKSRLLKKRDKYIAQRIADTLGPDETGILFIGAYHKVLKKLPKDIHVIELKEIEKVRKYQKLLPFHNRNKQDYEQLAQYLVKR